MEIRFFHKEIEQFIATLEKPTIAKVLRSFDCEPKRASSSARPSEAKQTRVHTPQLGSREKGRAERAPLAELAPRYIPLIC